MSQLALFPRTGRRLILNPFLFSTRYAWLEGTEWYVRRMGVQPGTGKITFKIEKWGWGEVRELAIFHHARSIKDLAAKVEKLSGYSISEIIDQRRKVA